MTDVFMDEALDPFSPDDIAEIRDQLESDAEKRDEKVVRYVERRAQAYSAVFSAGDTSQADIDFVLVDLASFTRAFEPTFDVNPKVQDLKEGRREVYLRIMKWAKLPAHILLTMYTKEQG